MAFGDIVQSIGGTNWDTNLTLTLGSTPTPGNLLLFCHFTGAAASTPPSGFTEAVARVDGPNADKLAIFYRVVQSGDGASHTVGVTYNENVGWLAEIAGPFESSPLDKTSATGPSSYQPTISTGTTAATVQADEFAVAAVSTRFGSASNMSGWTNSFTERYEGATSYKNMGAATRLLTAIGTVETTVNVGYMDSGSMAMVATFAKGTESTIHELTAQDLDGSAPVVGAPVAAQRHDLTEQALTMAAPVTGSPVAGQSHEVTAQNLTGAAPVTAAPVAAQAHDLTPADLTSAEPLTGSPVAGQSHNVTAVGLVSAEIVLGEPSAAQQHDLTVAGLVSAAPVLGTPHTGTVYELEAEDLTLSAPVLDAPEAAQQHDAVAQGLVAGATAFGAPAATQWHELVSADLTLTAPELDAPELYQEHGLTVVGLILPATEIGTPWASQSHNLTAGGLTSTAPVLGTPSEVDFISVEDAPVGRVLAVKARHRTWGIYSQDRTLDVSERNRVLSIYKEH